MVGRSRERSPATIALDDGDHAPVLTAIVSLGAVACALWIFDLERFIAWPLLATVLVGVWTLVVPVPRRGFTAGPEGLGWTGDPATPVAAAWIPRGAGRWEIPWSRVRRIAMVEGREDDHAARRVVITADDGKGGDASILVFERGARDGDDSRADLVLAAIVEYSGLEPEAEHGPARDDESARGGDVEVPPPRGRGLLNVALQCGLVVAAIAVWSAVFSPRFGVLLVAALLVHELGHVIVVLLCRHRVQGLYFVPPLGAFVAWRPQAGGLADRRLTLALVALGGPVVGGVTGLAGWGFGDLGHPWVLLGVKICLFLNLINLLPALPFDGGRVLQATMGGRTGPLASKLTGLVVLLSAVATLVIFDHGLVQALAVTMSVAFVAGMRRSVVRAERVRGFEQALPHAGPRVAAYRRWFDPAASGENSEDSAPLRPAVATALLVFHLGFAGMLTGAFFTAAPPPERPEPEASAPRVVLVAAGEAWQPEEDRVFALFLGESGLPTHAQNFTRRRPRGLRVEYHDDGRTHRLEGSVSPVDEPQDAFPAPAPAASGYEGAAGLLRQGTWTARHENGTLESRGEYVNGWCHGEWTFFGEDGQQRSAGRMDRDAYVGVWRFFDPHGMESTHDYGPGTGREERR